MSPATGFAIAWVGWLLSWGAAAVLWSRPTTQRASAGQQMQYRVALAAGAALVFLRFHWDVARERLLLAPTWLDWALLAVAVMGFAFAWWARVHLGALWSGSVSRKADQRIVDSGPYGVVRHPIYAGILVAACATILTAVGAFDLAALVMFTISFVMKARLEEYFLSSELGVESYAAYRRRVPMLLPFWRLPGR